MNHQILRPQFTNNIYKLYLQKGKSLNIFGKEGVGKSRFIEDLASLVEENVHFVTLNMRELRTDYAKFVDSLEEKLTLDDDFENIETVLALFEKKQGKKVLVIEHFEYLFEENRDDKFNFDFFDQLNSFKNHEEVSLLILSTRNYKHFHYYKGGELSTSPLDIEVMEITPLMNQEIVAELNSNIDKKLGFELLASWIMGKEYPYCLMKFIIREIQFGRYNADDFLERNFDRWEEQFRKENGVPTVVKVKSSIGNWSFSTLGEFILKGIKIWKKD